jgi:hypothetical protein
MLTDKQEKFAQCIADGMTQAEAYRTAYNAERMKDNPVYVNASKLMANANVALRVKELRKAMENKQLWTREKSVRALLGAYRVAQDRNQSTGMTAAVKELNAMHGFNAPTQVELSGGLQIQKIERVIVKP